MLCEINTINIQRVSLRYPSKFVDEFSTGMARRRNATKDARLTLPSMFTTCGKSTASITAYRINEIKLNGSLQNI